MDSALACRMLVFCGALMGVALVGSPDALAQSRPPRPEDIGKDPGALRQQEEQRKAEAWRNQQGQQQREQDQIYNDALRQQQARQQADAAQGQAVLRTWQQRPPLAAANNPLLGRWQTQGNGRRTAGNGNDIAALASAMIGGVTAGLCDTMLGSGLVEFRPAAVVAIGRDGKERTLYRAEYRGGGTRVAVLPQPGLSFTHMIVDLDRPDHASVAVVGCSLARVGAAAAAAAPAVDVAAAIAAAAWEPMGSSLKGETDFYAARSKISRSGGVAKMWEMTDSKSASLMEGQRVLSMKNLWEYDCKGSRRRMLAASAYAGHVGKGALVGSETFATPSPWQSVGPGDGYAHYFLKLACDKK